MTCNLPPKGWYCTRSIGHAGPCAAHKRKRLISNIMLERYILILLLLIAVWQTNWGTPFAISLVFITKEIEILEIKKKEYVIE